MAKIYGKRWRVLRSLRPGGQAETFVVEDQRSPGSEYVLKRIRNPDRHERLKAEIQALESLDHENIVRIVDSSLDIKQPYIVMEYCRGGSFEDHSKALANPLVAFQRFVEVLKGLSLAHAKGLTHRDIKPANVLLRTEAGPAVVADFGIVYVDGGERLTLTDEVVGARRFTPPELADGRADEVGPASDIYSAGKLLYWMLSGGKIFDREQHRERRYDLARREGGMAVLEHANFLLDRMITVDSKNRFQDAGKALVAAEKVQSLFMRDVRVLSDDLPQECAFCHQGTYRSVRTGSTTDIRNFGITPISSSEWQFLVCDNCGNTQYFRPDLSSSGRWWGPPGQIGPLKAQ